jgi:hypothetical protein
MVKKFDKFVLESNFEYNQENPNKSHYAQWDGDLKDPLGSDPIAGPYKQIILQKVKSKYITEEEIVVALGYGDRHHWDVYSKDKEAEDLQDLIEKNSQFTGLYRVIDISKEIPNVQRTYL